MFLSHKVYSESLMNIEQLLKDRTWHVEFEVDPNAGGGGQRIRVCGSSHSFRRLADLLTIMADKVEDSSHPASETGWHLGFNSELDQFSITNAAVLTLDCEAPA